MRQVAYLRTVAGTSVETLITRQRHDAAGRLVEQRDPRLSLPNLVTVFRLDGQPLKVDSVDAGPSLVLPGLAGEERRRWDARGNHWRTTYDDQLRAVAIQENTVPEVETLTYADASADPDHNLRGQMIALKDPSGTVVFHGFGLSGQALRETRTFHDAKAFVSSRTFSPLGTMQEQIDAGGHRQQAIHDIAGQLRQVKLQLKGQATWHTVLEDAQYNAAGQIIEQVAGNGVTSRWLYDPADGRLHRLIAQKDPASVLQDFEYQYDRVGNITAILDHAFTPRFFANQRVDGHRAFTYDSLYRLHSATGYADAPPSDNPGRPQPTDPNDRRNYMESYEYDHGDNLIKTTHVRDSASHAPEMFIDPASNRGVRWKPGDPPPDFDKLFDPAGNLLALQPGQPIRWNSRGQLESVTLVDRNGSGPDDAEHYRYSQGERVYKRLDTYTTKTSHFHEVRYLPGLEIRTKDNGEELHVITLDIGPGGVRYLHWEQDPANIGADQLRYTLNDHLGSAVKEFDGQAQLISDEGYLPFGATAYLTARSMVEVSYRTVRYSGKEMDVSGLYYYGARYYAPWLDRWISADPAGDVDGPNLYAFVGNNPIGFIDVNGEGKWPTMADVNAGIDRIIASENASYAKHGQEMATLRLKNRMNTQVIRQIEILGITKRRLRDAGEQLDRMGSGTDIALSATRRTLVLVASKAISYGAALLVGVIAQALGAVAPGVGNVLGAAIGFGTKMLVSGLVDYVAERTGLSASVNLKTSKLSPSKIIQKAEYKQMDPAEYFKAKYQNMNFGSRKSQLKLGKEATGVTSSVILKATLTNLPSEVVSAISSGLAALLGLPEVFNEVTGASRGKSEEKMDAFATNILGLADEIESSMTNIHEYANALSVSSINGIDVQELDEETKKITGMLYGFVSTLQNHRNNHKAAA